MSMTREKAKNILTSILHTDGAYMDYLDSEDVEAIKFLANDERPRGEWAYTTNHGRRFRICSVCKAEKEDDHATGWNFCQYCGSDNRKRDEAE